MLRRLSQKLLAQCRSYDVSCRSGGDEFCVLLPDSDLQVGVEFGTRLREALDRAPDLPQLSIGVAQAGPRDWPNASELIGLADRRMYLAKSHALGAKICAEDLAPPAQGCRSD